MRVAGTDRDRAGVHIPVIDVPAFLGGVSRSTAGELGHGLSLARLASFRAAGSVLQDFRLVNNARKIPDRLFVHDRRLRLSRLPDFRQVAAGQDCQETWCHAPSKRRAGRQAIALGGKSR